MMNKKFKPLIALPPTEGFDYLQRMIFKKSQEEMSKNIPIIVIPEEAKELRDEVQSLADNHGIEIAILGMGEGKRGMDFNLLAASLVLSTTISKKDNVTIIDNEEYSESKGNLFKYTNPYFITDPNPTIATQGDFYNPIFKEKDFSKPKKERVQNNRKKKKHKKAKNGR